MRIYLDDNEEGLLESRELRIVLADREIPHTVLSGIFTSVLDEMSRKGAVQGVLLIVDPTRATAHLRGVLLRAEPNPAKSLTTFSKSGGDGGFARLVSGNSRMQGDARHQSVRSRPAFAYAATISAPPFREEPLSGRFFSAKAMQSAGFRAFAAHRKALAAGDLEAAQRRATPGSFREIDALVAQAGKPRASRTLREMSSMPIAEDKPQVFVRGCRALIVYQTGDGCAPQSMLQSGGHWLVD